MRTLLLGGLFVVALGCGGGSQYDAPEAPAPEELDAITNLPLRSEVFAGQDLVVLPITLVVPDSTLVNGELFQHRDILLRMADSVIQSMLESRAPDVAWKFPPELRRTASRSPGMVPDPDRMGQSVMRTPSLETVPDPFRSNLRTLVGVTGGRLAFVPSALVFSQPEPGTVTARLMLVMADARTGRVVWRSLARGDGGSLPRALGAAMEAILPIQTFNP